MKFTSAVAKLKPGYGIRRKGWNGKDQFVFLAPVIIPALDAKKAGLSGVTKAGNVYILRNAQGSFQAGWLPSQGDLQAADWEIISVKEELSK